MKKNDEATKKEGVSWTFDTPSFFYADFMVIG